MKIVALAGGVGGAKLAHGFALCLPGEDLTIIVNTGDDFEHLGLKICPDLDTVCYTLAEIANPETGWGRSEETWNAIDSLINLGGPGWFKLGDRDLGTHLERTRRLHLGHRLCEITRDFCILWGIKATILPMSDDPIPTIVKTSEGELPFQEYFVLRSCEPMVKGFHFLGSGKASPAPGVLPALHDADLLVICPSNPWVSIDPILSLPSIRDTVQNMNDNGIPVLAVSPIVGGRAIKGPLAKMFHEMGMETSALSVAKHYKDLINIFVIDLVDEDLIGLIKDLEIEPLCYGTVMNSILDRKKLAKEILSNFI